MKPAFALWVAFVVGSVACAGPAPTTPPTSLVPASAPGSHVVFSGIAEHGAPVSTYSEAGYTITASSGQWTGSTTYGNPRPFIQFLAAKGEMVEGRLEVAAGGATFLFTSVDVYASVIPIPYTITGMRSGTVVFSASGTVPNTFGNFRTVTSANPNALIDRLLIILVNSASSCCSNPMGVDNLIFGQ